MNGKPIGPSFSSEVWAAGLGDLAVVNGSPFGSFSWTSEGEIYFGPAMTQAQIDAVNTIYAAHDPTKPAPPLVPQVVTRYQARAALAEAGLLQQVNDYFAALPDDDLGKLAWLEAPTVVRQSAALIEAAHDLGLTDNQIDALFSRAAEFQ